MDCTVIRATGIQNCKHQLRDAKSDRIIDPCEHEAAFYTTSFPELLMLTHGYEARSVNWPLQVSDNRDTRAMQEITRH